MGSAAGADREAAIARELTELHEQTASGTLGELAAQLGGAIPLKGEFVIIVAGAAATEPADQREVRRIFGVLAARLEPSAAVALCSAITGVARNRVYALTRK